MSDEDESGTWVDPYRLEAMRLAVQRTERHPVALYELIECAVVIEEYLRTGATS